MILDDTIVAISSAVGAAARVILRLSGPDALHIAGQISPEASLRHRSARRARLDFCDLRCPAFVYCFMNPNSYTGEDLVEFHLPGNPLLARMLMEDLVRRGARPAEAGEFTARAYFNGKIDLTQAEGVAATIAASSARQFDAARQLMAGELSRRLRAPMDSLANLLALIEVGIDFSEEDVRFISHSRITEQLSEIRLALEALLAGSARFESLSREPRIVLAGRPNAGKSTLMNALAGEHRSIVSPIAGTTRDVLSAHVMLPRGIVHLLDVAGIEDANEARDQAFVFSPSPGTPGEGRGENVQPGCSCSTNGISTATSAAESDIHQQMRQNAERAIEISDVLVLVHDITDNRPPLALSRPVDLVIRSKQDLLANLPSAGSNLVPPQILVGAQTGDGLESLRHALDQLAFGKEASAAALVLTSRHCVDIGNALVTLSRAETCPPGDAELLAADLRSALDDLGQILGVISPDDLLGRIFSTFCIGK